VVRSGKGEGVVTGVQKAKGKATAHLVRFSDNPAAASEAVLLQKEAGGKGRKFHILLEARAAPGEGGGAGPSAAQLQAELAKVKREHSKYTSARIAAELEKAQAAHKAELEKTLQAERERGAAEAGRLRAELAHLKKEE
jgi:hypothetical protein